MRERSSLSVQPNSPSWLASTMEFFTPLYELFAIVSTSHHSDAKRHRLGSTVGVKKKKKKSKSCPRKALNPQVCVRGGSSHKTADGSLRGSWNGRAGSGTGMMIQNNPFPSESWVPSLSWWPRVTQRDGDHHAFRSEGETKTYKTRVNSDYCNKALSGSPYSNVITLSHSFKKNK